MPETMMPAPEIIRANPAAQTVAQRHGMSVDALWSTMGDRERAAALDALQRQQQGPRAQLSVNPTRQVAPDNYERPVEPNRRFSANPSYQERVTGPQVMEQPRGLPQPPGGGRAPMSVMPNEQARWDYPVPPQEARGGDAPPRAPGAPPPGAQNPMVGPEPHDTRNPRAREIVMQRRRDEDRELREAAAARRAEREEASRAALAPDPDHEWGRSLLRDAGQMAARTWRPELSVQGVADAVNRTINPVVSYATGGFEFPTSDGQTRWMRDRVDAAVRENRPAAAPVEGQTTPQRRPAPPPVAQEPIEGQTRPRPRGQGQAPEPPAPNPQRDGRPLSFGAASGDTTQRAVQATAQAAPATAAALDAGARRLSVQNTPGQMPSQAQYRRAANDMVDRFVNEWGPKEFMHLMEQGRVAEAFAWREFYESKDAQEQADHFGRAAFASMAGDTNMALSEFAKAVGNSPVADMYEVVKGQSRIFGQNRGEGDPYARITVRNRQTDELFTLEPPTEEDFFSGMTQFAAPEAAFQNKMQGIYERVAAIRAQHQNDEEAIVDMAFRIMQGQDDLAAQFGGDKMTEQEAVERARALLAGSRAVAQSGLGSLGHSQGGARNPDVPSVGAP